MADPADPALAGTKAGRVVGVLTALLLVGSLLAVQDRFVGRIETIIQLTGIDPRGTVSLYFWLYLLGAAVARYVFCYLVGSLIGVLYDWLDEPRLWHIVAAVLAVGIVDASVARLDTGSTLVAGGYLLAWLTFVPVYFYTLEQDDSEWGKTRRIGNEKW